ncbi:MAG: esterase/lipase family protein [Myxococcota bacterium]
MGAETINPVERGDTVVLLHGLGRSARNMLILEWRLRAMGYSVCNLNYDTRVQGIEEILEEVAPAVKRCAEGAEAVHFVTHSLGGLVLRALLEAESLPEAGRAVMLAPPNQGSEIADELRDLRVTKSVLGPIAGQLGTRESDLPQSLSAPRIPFGVIAGDRWVNPVGPIWLPSPHDGTVSVASTRLDGMEDHLVLPHTHTFIVNSAGVARQVDAFLRQGRFNRGPSNR